MIAADPVRGQADDRAKTRTQVCRHCGLPFGRARDLGPFCCAGCKNVHELLHAQGLERFYELRGESDAPPPELRPDTFAWLDPLLAASKPAENGTQRLTLDVQGVHCAACVWLLQELWNRERGAVDLRVNPALGRAEFLWKPAEFDLRRYLRVVERFGYRFGAARKRDLGSTRGLVVRLGVCFAAALNTMIFSLCYYVGLTPQDGELYGVLGRWSFALATLAVAFGGSLFFVSAWRGLRRGVAHLDLPIAVGIALGYGGSVWAWLARGPEASYFDTITIFVALMVLGRWLQERVLERNRLSLLASDGVDDLYTRRRRNDVLETIPAASIEPGDELWILPGDLVPVEGTVLGERATMSLDWITGESRPRTFEPGENVPAGSFQAGATATRLAAAEGFSASRLHSLLGSGAKPLGREDRQDRWWSRFATVYVFAVLALATVGFVFWLPRGLERGIEVALSVLVVTCPCALGLAMPLANELVHMALRRRGIFLREASFLRRALRVRHVLFDKTGTLTRGTLRLTERSLGEIEALDPESRAVLAQGAAQSLHPVSRCIHAALSRGGRTQLVQGLEVREFAGRGLELRLGARTWTLGNRAFVVGTDSTQAARTLFARDGVVLAALEVEEELNSDAREEVRRLEAGGLRVHVLSGDRDERVTRVASELGVDPERVRGALSPEEKARYVRTLDMRNTWMIGDGINDGLAFDAAYCAATPAVDRPNLPSRADLFYLGDGVGAVRVTLAWARRLASVLRANLVLAITYNLVVVAACLAGQIGPIAAAVLMPLSSIGFLMMTTLRLSRRTQAWTS
ncbi:MAG: heavy metal translocating P-type ATPase metal-binding domain-containing protein [Planctomycetes bacterium]|nr:heavy metal translocating P-type ATPase metal-binding domain-containing protein [Planctomycetota bacterium]